MRLLARHKHVRKLAIETIDVIDVFEVTHSLVEPQQVEVRRADEIDIRFDAVKIAADFGNVLQLFLLCH
jgi:hypothetical protein